MPNNITLTVPEGFDPHGSTLTVNGKTYRREYAAMIRGYKS